MKKYFLLISLFTLVFLGLGNNYSFGQTLTPQQQLNLDNCGNINSPYNIGTQQCSSPYTTNMLTTPTAGSPCGVGIKPSGGVTNSFDKCVCPSGTKNVKDVCKPCSDEGVCCGISLNTSIPFIGNCIEDSVTNRGPGETSVTGATAFPVLMGSLTKILVTFILIISFVLIIIGGIMIATGNPGGGKKMIIKVVVGIALLGASGVILRLINPNFFG